MDDVFFPFPNREACRIVFKEDPCYEKIPRDNRQAVFDDAWNLGVATADKVWNSTSHPADMRTILHENGLVLKEANFDHVVGNTRYFCEYQSEKNVVTIYRKSIEIWAKSNSMSYEDSVQLILAHELFHYFEWHKIGLASKRCLVPMLKMGKIELGKTGIAALSEIAANAFANEWYRLSTENGQMSIGLLQKTNEFESMPKNAEPERTFKNLLKRMLSI